MVITCADAQFGESLHACMMQVTLLHFTHPLWFDELGAFEKDENNIHFIR
jgi:hypothetical protein